MSGFPISPAPGPAWQRQGGRTRSSPRSTWTASICGWRAGMSAFASATGRAGRSSGVRLHDRQGRLVADVVDDAVAMLDGSRPAARFRELEVAYLRALGGRDAAPPEVVLSRLSSGASLCEVVSYAIAGGATRLIRHDAVVRLDTDPEGVHQARVATRRLRSDLRTLHRALDPHWSRELRDELGWLGRALGAARDADVLLARLAARAQALPAASADGVRRRAGCCGPRPKNSGVRSRRRRSPGHAGRAARRRGRRGVVARVGESRPVRGQCLRRQGAGHPRT
jgi:CHAD domain